MHSAGQAVMASSMQLVSVTSNMIMRALPVLSSISRTSGHSSAHAPHPMQHSLSRSTIINVALEQLLRRLVIEGVFENNRCVAAGADGYYQDGDPRNLLNRLQVFLGVYRKIDPRAYFFDVFIP